MDEAYTGSIVLFAGNFAPAGWAFCQGQSLPANQYSALYSIIGNAFGGNSVNFNLPDLRGAVPVSSGQAKSGTSYILGQGGGSETTTLNLSNLPAHNHQMLGSPAPVTGTISATMNVNNTNGGETSPNGNFLGQDGSGAAFYASAGDGSSKLNSGAISVNSKGLNVNPASFQIGNTGRNQPAKTMSPYLTLNYIICLNGVYPPKS